MTVITDNSTLFNIIIRNAHTTEIRFMIDIKVAKETYNEEIVDDIICMSQSYNLVNAMTKIANQLQIN